MLLLELKPRCVLHFVMSDSVHVVKLFIVILNILCDKLQFSSNELIFLPGPPILRAIFSAAVNSLCF